MGKIFDYFEKNQEQAFIVKAVLVIVSILLVREYLSFLFFYFLVIILPVFFLSFVLSWSAYTGDSVIDIIRRNLTILPGIYSDGRKKGEHRPVVTYSLVFINIAIYYVIQCALVDDETISRHFVFLPMEPNYWNTPVSMISSMFLHGSQEHLWGNMFFLWGVGTELEKRVGQKNFLLLYLLTGIVAGLIFITTTYLFLGEVGHALGASGAISGIMGVFAVRCYFKTMVFPIPILGVLPVSFKVHMNSIVMMGLFFMMDFEDGIAQLSGTDVGNVAHWAHLGGMMGGFLVAGWLKLGKGAIEERHAEIGLERLREGVGLGEGEQSLRTALEQNEENIEVILALARTKSRRHGIKFTLTEEGGQLYEKAIRLMISSHPQEAAEVYVEYFKLYQKGIEPSLQFRIAGLLYRKGELDSAAKALEMLAESDSVPAGIREKSLFQAAKIMEEMELPDAAQMYYGRFLEAFPESSLVPKVRARLDLA